MRNEQYENDETIGLTKRIRTGISIKENKILVKKRRDGSCHKSKGVRIEIITFNIYKTRRTIVYKELSRRLTS